MDLDFAAARLRSTLVEPGCAICHLARDAVAFLAGGAAAALARHTRTPAGTQS